MTLHVRRQVREAIAAALTGLPTTGGRVKTAHPYPLASAEMPGLVILVPEEQVAVDAMGPSLRLSRTMQVWVLGYAEGMDVENTLDAMSAEVEAALAGAFPVGGAPVRQIIPVAASIEVDGDSRVRTGMVRLTFEVFTRTTAADPTVSI